MTQQQLFVGALIVLAGGLVLAFLWTGRMPTTAMGTIDRHTRPRLFWSVMALQVLLLAFMIWMFADW